MRIRIRITMSSVRVDMSVFARGGGLTCTNSRTEHRFRPRTKAARTSLRQHDYVWERRLRSWPGVFAGSSVGSYAGWSRNNLSDRGGRMGRGILLWLLGVPIPIILLLALCSHH
jgi:hypothetical protein